MLVQNPSRPAILNTIRTISHVATLNIFILCPIAHRYSPRSFEEPTLSREARFRDLKLARIVSLGGAFSFSFFPFPFATIQGKSNQNQENNTGRNSNYRREACRRRCT